MTAGPRTAGHLEIIDFRPEYAAAFRDLNTEWLERHFFMEPIDVQILANPAGEIIEHGGAILFARKAGEIVGTVALKHHGAGVFELTKMAVTASAQGAGIGRTLLVAALDRYRSSGGARLYLESHSSLAPALHLYESLGFRYRPEPRPSPYRRADVYMQFEGVTTDLPTSGHPD